MNPNNGCIAFRQGQPVRVVNHPLESFNGREGFALRLTPGQDDPNAIIMPSGIWTVRFHDENGSFRDLEICREWLRSSRRWETLKAQRESSAAKRAKKGGAR